MKEKNEVLVNLYYSIGKQATNFRIFHNYVINGEKRFSDWVYFLDASGKDVELATHRTILKNEVVLDFDPEKGQSFDDLTYKVRNVCKDLRRKGVEYFCYFTGSRGYHVHIFVYDMFSMGREERRAFRVNIIRFFGAELQKSSEGTAIALEGVPHWKSGKVKLRCDF